ncbi:MAG: DUF3313 family protein [Pseudomonadales bacterium]
MKYLFLLLTFTFLAGCETTSPTLQTGANAEITFDGLHRVDGSNMQYAWLKPNLSLAAYTKIRLVNAGIEYRQVKPASGSPSVNASRSEFPLTEKKKARLESLLREVFLEELSNSKHFSLVSEPGPDVLTLTGGLLDVVSAIPPESAGRNDFYVSNIGSAKLVLELQDSRSNEILARALDGRNVQPLSLQRSSPGINAQEVRREFRKWGKRLTAALDLLHEGQP